MARTSQSVGQGLGMEGAMTMSEILDKRFEDDLEKAIAASLETQRMEDLKREGQVENWKGRGGNKDVPDSVAGLLHHPSDKASQELSMYAPSYWKDNRDDTMASNEPDLMLFNFKHVMKSYDEKKEAEEAPPVPPRGFGVQAQLRPVATHRPGSYQFMPTTQASLTRPTYNRQSSFPNSNVPFEAPQPSTATKRDSSQWVDPLLSQALSGPGLAQTKSLRPSSSTGLPTPPLPARRSVNVTDMNSLLKTANVPNSSQWQTKMRASYHDDTLIGSSAYWGHSPVASGLSVPISFKRTSLDNPFDLTGLAGHNRAALSTSPTAARGNLNTGLSSLRISENSSMRRISSNPNFQTGITPVATSSSPRQSLAAPQVIKQSREPSRVSFSASPPETSSAKAPTSAFPGSLMATTSQTSSLFDETWKKKFPPDSSAGATKSSSDLMAFSPPPSKAGSGASTDVFDFREFDPLQPPPPVPVSPKKPKSASVATDMDQYGEDSVFRDSEEKFATGGRDVTTSPRPSTSKVPGLMGSQS
ncbi:uncharacterized protein LOC110975485 [Acanthaster planci]|uniref:Uncharacterized protein LOC110975485 n=1 Tax=Acanthaster planci TaxID=133434 RepID=A0A8B7XS79_ACAPL|nr:uncharacterized protein LOC110975485 [Acanthaster planci]